MNKKKIALLSGAYKNAGDYLIESRSVSLLHHVYPDAEIEIYLRNKIHENLDDINKCDIAVFGGGPIYQRDLDGYLPLDLCINSISCPIFILGGGWYGPGSSTTQIKKYHFSDKTLSFLKKVSERGGLSCRDIISYQILKNQGFNSVAMTGCPAWYDLGSIDSDSFRSTGDPKRIIISDPAKKQNLPSCLALVDYVVRRYPQAEITVAFHRGLPEQARRQLADRHIKAIDISGSKDGFKIYDDCDLHIGFRVHAHIYNISIRNRSVLIEEDGRGAGVDLSLGLPQIRAYNDQFQFGGDFANKVYKRTPFYQNREMINELGPYLDNLEATDYQYIKNAFKMQQTYFDSMTAFIEGML